ncbi:MAG: hypothetical protein WDO17_03850 [Alphaproteobacteria bacterium]
MRALRNVHFAVLALALSLAAAGRADAASINYGSQTTASVTVFYSGLPANTQLFLRNWVTGGEAMAAVPPVSGTGSVVVPFNVLPPGPGEFEVVGRDVSGWVAQSVTFYLFI